MTITDVRRSDARDVLGNPPTPPGNPGRQTAAALTQASWAERRGRARRPVEIECRIRGPWALTRVVALVDLSTDGCRLRCAVLRSGDPVWLRIAGLAPQLASVAWTTFEEAGVRFGARLHPAVVDHLAAAHEPR